MAKGLTDRQQEVLDYIVKYIEERGYPPTIRDMQEGLGIGSLRGVTIHLDALHKKGFIERISAKNGPRTSRGIRVLARRPGEKPEDLEAGVVRLPLITKITPGIPLIAIQNVEDIIPVHRGMLRGASIVNHFLLRVKGDSMSGGHIMAGDLAIVQPQTAVENGDIVAARFGEEPTVKRFWRHGNRIELQAMNPNYAPRPLRRADDAALLGKVIGLLRTFTR
jgi:repressor LexA